jgi:hypothetical protein
VQGFTVGSFTQTATELGPNLFDYRYTLIHVSFRSEVVVFCDYTLCRRRS